MEGNPYHCRLCLRRGRYVDATHYGERWDREVLLLCPRHVGVWERAMQVQAFRLPQRVRY